MFSESSIICQMEELKHVGTKRLKKYKKAWCKKVTFLYFASFNSS